MSWWLLGGSLAAVLFMAWMSHALGLGGAAFDGEEAAMAEAEALVPGFVATSAHLDDDGATVVGEDGHNVRVRRLGARWVADG